MKLSFLKKLISNVRRAAELMHFTQTKLSIIGLTFNQCEPNSLEQDDGNNLLGGNLNYFSQLDSSFKTVSCVGHAFQLYPFPCIICHSCVFQNSFYIDTKACNHCVVKLLKLTLYSVIQSQKKILSEALPDIAADAFIIASQCKSCTGSADTNSPSLFYSSSSSLSSTSSICLLSSDDIPSEVSLSSQPLYSILRHILPTVVSETLRQVIGSALVWLIDEPESLQMTAAETIVNFLTQAANRLFISSDTVHEIVRVLAQPDRQINVIAAVHSALKETEESMRRAAIIMTILKPLQHKLSLLLHGRNTTSTSIIWVELQEAIQSDVNLMLHDALKVAVSKSVRLVMYSDEETVVCKDKVLA
eukprot:CAMPEP_0182428426 /NCGR_PEP_ID=MMETSP1167-20130531/23022_1 /TAXON_ID=2988 /ORGANISM="Mallomonas Sp, Strain CCMP3275" /LENGTH=359 /DNA_ID=CAMNT_0024611349 /DNA_START=407 /DNA_END=1486 /DNA_ORIENTATION=+